MDKHQKPSDHRQPCSTLTKFIENKKVRTAMGSFLLLGGTVRGREKMKGKKEVKRRQEAKVCGGRGEG